MEYRVTIEGLPPGIIFHNGAAGLDTRSPQKLEIAEISRKRGSNRTATDDARLAELECQLSLHLNASGTPTIPTSMLRANIENAARKLKQGPQVREGLIVSRIESFDYDEETFGTTVSELGLSTQYTVPVVVQRNRILRTRARFPEWQCTFNLDCDDELVDQSQIETWLDIGGRRIGVGDWRPQKSGEHGRFKMISIEPLV